MTQETLYKWLLPNRITPVQKKKWPVRVGVWTKEECTVICESGWHGVERKDILKHLPNVEGAELWEVEIKGKRLDGDDKFSAPQMRLVRKIITPTNEQLIEFACDVAASVLSIYEDRYPGDNRVRDCIEVTRRFGQGKATVNELNAASSAASNAAYSAAYAAYNAASNEMFCKRIGV